MASEANNQNQHFSSPYFARDDKTACKARKTGECCPSLVSMVCLCLLEGLSQAHISLLVDLLVQRIPIYTQNGNIQILLVRRFCSFSTPGDSREKGGGGGDCSGDFLPHLLQGQTAAAVRFQSDLFSHSWNGDKAIS